MIFIPIAEPVIGEREIEYVDDAIRSGWVSSIGPYIERFEVAFAEYLGVSYAISVSNGTTGLHLALIALGIGPGDEVIVPDMTFVATVHAVLLTGATPVLVDVNPHTWCLDPVAVKNAITTKTRAVIPVHLYGHPADMIAINQIAQEYGLFVIEDAAEAHGALVNSKKVGTLGKVGVFSFYGNKIITTGEGGIVTTNDAKLAGRLRYLKDHGMSPDRRYYHTELAFNYRMTNLQAALGLAQLEQIEHFIEKKRQIYQWYSELLDNIPCIKLQVELPGFRNVFWLFCIVLEANCKLSRHELGQSLRQQGIDWRPFFIPMHQLPHLSHLKKFGVANNECNNSIELGERGLSLPSGCQLDQKKVQFIAEVVKQLLNK